MDEAIAAAVRAQPDWDDAGRSARAAALDRAADLFEQNLPELVAMCVREAGKTVPDSIAEVREAVDFLRYYAARAREDFGAPLRMPGPTGESNELSLHGRGVFACISPWNFPLAIFTGQVAAALAAGNAVVAKPAEQTPLVAAQAVRLLLQAGVPARGAALPAGRRRHRRRARGRRPARCRRGVHRLDGDGAPHPPRARRRAKAPIPVLIAETGGQNAMIVDSSALPEQVVLDAVQSAFNSAGQRCSALRVLCVQEDIAPKVQRLLAGYMDELVVGDPALLETDVGPVIDAAARDMLERHARAIVQRRAAGITAASSAPATRARHLRRAARGRRSSRSTCSSAKCSARSCTCCRTAPATSRALVDAINATGLRADVRHPQPHRQHRAARGVARHGRQRLREPQHDRRGRRHAAVRRLRPVGHRARRPAGRTTCTASRTSAR